MSSSHFPYIASDQGYITPYCILSYLDLADLPLEDLEAYLSEWPEIEIDIEMSDAVSDVEDIEMSDTELSGDDDEDVQMVDLDGEDIVMLDFW